MPVNEARAQFRGAGTIIWVKPRRLIIAGRPKSLRLEDDIWNLLRLMAAELGVTTTKLISAINIAKNPTRTLSSALRVAVACYWYAAASHKGLVSSGPGGPLSFRIGRSRKPRKRSGSVSQPPA
jgi:predicted DNA-binding ribbon-helix-helix protein